MSAIKIAQDIWWVGAKDPELRTFDIIMHTPSGSTYNSYLVKSDSGFVLIDAVKETFTKNLVENIKSVCSLDEIKYIIVNHTEPDHSGALNLILKDCPNATIYGTNAAITYLKAQLNREVTHVIVEDGQELNLGNRTLKFAHFTYLHWPDSMFTILKEDRIAFTCDVFGAHHCWNKEPILHNSNDLYDEDIHNYFVSIFGPYHKYIRNMLAKTKCEDFNLVCPSHGCMITGNSWKQFYEHYVQWSKEKAKRLTVVVAYASVYKFTKMLSDAIVEGIKSAGGEALVFDLEKKSGPFDATNALIDSAAVIIGSPTLVADAVPPVWAMLGRLNPQVHKKKVAAAFGSYGWSGEAVPHILERFTQLKFKVVDGLKVRFRPTPEDLNKARELGIAVVERIKSEN